jgi:DNA polymerase-3 subunit epsilon
MKYLSIDIEATGLAQDDLMIEFGMIPFDSDHGLREDLARNFYIQCPSFEELAPRLDQWVAEHNEQLIRKAHSDGISISSFKNDLISYLESPEVKSYFGDQDKGKITLFGKSMSAIDLPFLNRDLGWDFMRKYFQHRQLDLSSVAYALIDLKLMPQECTSGSYLMKHLGLGDVCHTALEDARNTALMYLKIRELYAKN